MSSSAKLTSLQLFVSDFHMDPGAGDGFACMPIPCSVLCTRAKAVCLFCC